MIAASIPPKAKESDALSTPALLALVSEIGFLIAIPAVAFGFGGAWLDKQFDTAPLLTLVGLALALLSSILAVWYRIKPFLQ